MQLVTVVIKPFKLDEVKAALDAAGVQGLTVTEVRGYGRQLGKSETWRGAEYKVDFVPKLKIEIVVATADVERTLEVVARAAGTGHIGDGKAWVVEVDHVLRIRTGEEGSDAL